MILIIGSEGFIGSHLMKYYSNVNALGCQTNPNNKKENSIYVNKLNPDFDSVFKNHDVTLCINASGSKGVGFSIEYTEIDYVLNVENTKKILKAIQNHAPKCKFINLSSAAVYGNPVKLPIKETDPTIPISPYGEHKLLAENITTEFYVNHNVSSCSLRIFSVFGPGLKKQLLWDVYQKTLNMQSNSISLFGTGLESRDYIYIDDLIEAIQLVVLKSDFKGAVYNVANGIEVKVEKITKLLIKGLNNNIEINFNEEVKEGDPLNWLSDIGCLKAFGYKRTVSIEEGIHRYTEWLREE
jgi:UDP-glucose 4-epimerase